jgi:hypothetical protein
MAKPKLERRIVWVNQTDNEVKDAVDSLREAIRFTRDSYGGGDCSCNVAIPDAAKARDFLDIIQRIAGARGFTHVRLPWFTDSYTTYCEFGRLETDEEYAASIKVFEEDLKALRKNNKDRKAKLEASERAEYERLKAKYEKE